MERAQPEDGSVNQNITFVTRGFGAMSVEKPLDAGRLVLSLAGGGVTGSQWLPRQEWLTFGGPLSAPGYGYHALLADAGVTMRAERRFPVSAPAFSLGRFGRVPGQATLAPFMQATAIHRPSIAGGTHPSGMYPSLGLAVTPVYDLLRIQLARGLRNGLWTFNVDVSREFWSVL